MNDFYSDIVVYSVVEDCVGNVFAVNIFIPDGDYWVFLNGKEVTPLGMYRAINPAHWDLLTTFNIGEHTFEYSPDPILPAYDD